MSKNITDRQQYLTMKCDCCEKEFDRRVARVVDESFPHKSMNHYVCPKCFSDIQYRDNKGLMGWYLTRRMHKNPPAILFMEYINGKGCECRV